jgi:hypothetical protein
MNKIVEIFTAWGISFNPNDEQAQLAAERIAVCKLNLIFLRKKTY